MKPTAARASKARERWNMFKIGVYFCRFLLVLGLLSAYLAWPAPARADGGMVIPDSELWRMIDEGQQIAVVTLQTDQAVKVDLFLSFLDRSQDSHQVTFFVPLGTGAGDFSVEEKTSTQFDEANTQRYDQLLNTEARRATDYRRNLLASLAPGTLVINGGWSWPILLGVILSACGGAAPAPQATYQTANSTVSIYSVESQTNLQELIETAGLDPAVQQTLESLRGQEIAVVNLQTQPPPAAEDYQAHAQGQPGLHLAWTTRLDAQSTYAYPLGTGRAWANPIDLTRVYVVAPAGVDFVLQYPRLGEDRSGLSSSFYGYAVTIDSASQAAYAINNAVGDFGRVWRITYRKSNAAEDILITRSSELTQESRALLRRIQLERLAGPLAWLVNLLIGLAAWVVNWRWVMNRRLNAGYQWRAGNLWKDALGWAALYPFLLVVVGLVGFWIATTVRQASNVAMTLAVLLFILLASGAPNLYLFARSKARAGLSGPRAVGAYLLTVLLANLCYLPAAGLLVGLLLNI